MKSILSGWGEITESEVDLNNTVIHCSKKKGKIH